MLTRFQNQIETAIKALHAADDEATEFLTDVDRGGARANPSPARLVAALARAARAVAAAQAEAGRLSHGGRPPRRTTLSSGHHSVTEKQAP